MTKRTRAGTTRRASRAKVALAARKGAATRRWAELAQLDVHPNQITWSAKPGAGGAPGLFGADKGETKRAPGLWTWRRLRR